MTKKTFYISTPIYYPSGKPHVGHAFTTILGDVISKYKRLIGYDVFYLTGTDEHGKKIEEAAKSNGLKTIDFINKNVDVFKNLWKLLGIDYSCFIRTTDKKHIETVQKIFTIYNEKKLIYKDNWNGMYCISCEENIPPKDIVVDNDVKKCQVGHDLVETKESSYFFEMSKFKTWIKDELQKNKGWIQPQSRVNELINNFIDSDLQDLSISRTSFSWGIKIREDKEHVIYVWMDALFNYLTAIDYLQDNDDLYQKFWNHKDAEIVHLLSKEITRFHCVYWPIFLHVLGVKLPTKILSHGWIVTKTGKMSKSFGNVIDPIEIIDKYGRDCLRYYLIKEMSLSNDNVFYIPSMLATYNGDLANNIGNLISRTIGMLNKYNDSTIPPIIKASLDNEDKSIIEKIKKTNNQIIESINNLNCSNVLVLIQDLINVANKYIENKKPWELWKSNQKNEVSNLLNILSNIVRCCFYWLQPVLIDGSKEAAKQFNLDLGKINVDNINDLTTLDNHKVDKSCPIYLRKEIPND